jgi:hypothetical protein
MWQATDTDHALAQAEDEATRYAGVSDCEFLGFCQAYALPASVAVTNVEVFSLLRESKLISREYIDAFFDTGTERGSGHA